MSQDNAVRDRVTSAWDLYRNAQYQQSADAFEALARDISDEVDVYYGLGLALRATGQADGAIDAFRKGYDLSLEKLQAVRDAAKQSEHHAAENLGITEEDRYMMLTRMLHQRLAEHDIDVPAVLEVF